jgi:hypothetical protein
MTDVGVGAEGSAVPTGGSRSAGIYGTIVTASVLVSAGGEIRIARLEILVFGTLVVYWLAELYAEVVGEHIRGGRLPRRSEIRGLAGPSWQLVAASYIPLATLTICGIAGMSEFVASYVALGVTVVLLVVHSMVAGRASGLTGWRLAGGAATAALFGLAMVALKVLVTH